jgi:hypothetical protein
MASSLGAVRCPRTFKPSWAALLSYRAGVVLLLRGATFCDLKEIHNGHDVAVVGRTEDVSVSDRSGKGSNGGIWHSAHTYKHTLERPYLVYESFHSRKGT